jgi:hypothetical protein
MHLKLAVLIQVSERAHDAYLPSNAPKEKEWLAEIKMSTGVMFK